MQDVLKRLFNRSDRNKPKEKIELQSSDPAIWGHPLVQQCYLQMSLGRREIETSIDDKELVQKLLDRVIGQWRALEAEPYWCNDTSDVNRLANISDKAIRDFYAQGPNWMKTLEAFESRSGIKIENGVCVELGAGVGKYTHALARRFERVIAVDVSSRLLEISDARMKTFGLKNVTTSLLMSPGDISKFGKIDFFMAWSVLQHNPPPIQKMMLDDAFESLNPGGFALFQTPDWLDGYTFSSKRFLKEAPETMCDCHCLPKTVVLDILKSQGMELLDFAPDFNTQSFGSYTYFARKVGSLPN